MIRKRRNAYLSALFILVGVLLLIIGTFVPAINLTSKVGGEFWHLSVAPSSDVESTSALPVMLTFGLLMLGLAALLAMTRRQGLGIVWRSLCVASLFVPAAVVAVFWYLVTNPSGIATADGMPMGNRLMGALATTSIGNASPGTGLWLLTFGCVIVFVGCFVPAKKHKEVIIRDDDPGYRDYNPYIQEFQQHQLRTYQQQNDQQPQYRQQDEVVWQPQRITPDDQYGSPRYYGNG
jgi:hypothetical protein